MSHLATNWAVLQRGISPVAKLILWHLADCHHPKHGCFPHIETLVTNCEVSRATVLRVLHELEARGMVLRIKRVHEHTKKQLTNKYILGFESDFANHAAGTVLQVYTDEDEDEGRVSDCDPAQTSGESRVQILDPAPDAAEGSPAANTDDSANSGSAYVRDLDTAQSEKSRVSDCDPASESRVSNKGQAGCQNQGEPGVTAETPNRSVTGNRTSKGTGKRADGRDRESLFAEIWKVFPRNPTSSNHAASETFKALDDAEALAAVKGAGRFAAWWKLQEVDKPLETRLRFVKHLSRWLYERGWIEALKLPLPTEREVAAAEAMAGKITVNKWRQPELFAACERVLGRSVPVGAKGAWTFDEALVEEAKKRLGSGSGPP